MITFVEQVLAPIFLVMGDGKDDCIVFKIDEQVAIYRSSRDCVRMVIVTAACTNLALREYLTFIVQ